MSGDVSKSAVRCARGGTAVLTADLGLTSMGTKSGEYWSANILICKLSNMHQMSIEAGVLGVRGSIHGRPCVDFHGNHSITYCALSVPKSTAFNGIDPIEKVDYSHHILTAVW